MHSLRIVFAHDGIGLAIYGPLAIAVIEGADRPDAVRRTLDELARLRRTTHKSELHYLYVASENAEMPSTESRTAASSLSRFVDSSMGVHEGEGFRASVIRAVVTGIGMAGGKLPEVVASVSEAADKLSARHASLGTAADLRAAVEALRRATREG